MTNFLRDVSVRFAGLGCTAIAPGLFHRTGAFEIPYEDGDDIARPHNRRCAMDGQIADVQATYAWLTTAAQCGPDKIAAYGFCMGGRLAYVANAHLPLRAAISFYGGRIAPDLLRFAPQQQGPLLFFWGGRDDVIPKEQIRAVSDGLDAAGVEHEQVVFSHALHSFFCHVREEYHESASKQAWAMSLVLLRQQGVLDG